MSLGYEKTTIEYSESDGPLQIFIRVIRSMEEDGYAPYSIKKALLALGECYDLYESKNRSKKLLERATEYERGESKTRVKAEHKLQKQIQETFKKARKARGTTIKQEIKQ